ncbi:peptidoglycan DD-metalloendopeptidase family protein [Candidatus Kaiserbacteria bacterium]|nr:peptidoglycan DD-metalloendopeptidase family protein [Candidatus Kaiserbacteria bacterium]
MKPQYTAFCAGLFLALAVFLVPKTITPVYAQSIGQLRDQIEEKNDQLAQIEAEIAKYQEALQQTGAEKDTLQRTIDRLNLEKRKVEADISYTQNKISATDLTINKLAIEIVDTEDSIDRNKGAISEILKRIDETDRDSLIIAMLRYERLTEFWDTIEQREQVRDSMGDQVHELLSYKDVLEEKHSESTEQKAELVALKNQYRDQQQVLEVTKSEKDSLLQQTERKEEIYQNLLAEKEAAKAQFLEELADLESQLKFILDPDSIPSAGSAVLRWPLDSIYITQYFGNTAFAQSGAYNGSGHNGVDFGTPTGTKVRAALSGTVTAWGNTDFGGCSSYGKWILLKHANGLSTLYAHLSLISVNKGDSVSTGDIIGYSGNTGYSTGPHLHFTVFATSGVQVLKLADYYAQNGRGATACSAAGVSIPVAAYNAYLNPIDYLPSL